MFAPGLLPVGFFMDECLHENGDKREGGNSHASRGGKHRTMCFCLHLIDITLTVVSLPVV